MLFGVVWYGLVLYWVVGFDLVGWVFGLLWWFCWFGFIVLRFKV